MRRRQRRLADIAHHLPLLAAQVETLIGEIGRVHETLLTHIRETEEHHKTVPGRRDRR